MDKEIVRNSMVFFESFYSSAEELPDDQFRLAWKAICEYAFYDIEPEDMPLPVKIFFKLVKPNIDSIIKQRAAGQSGGRPKKPRVMESKTPGYETKNPGLSNQKPRVTKSETSPIYDVDVDVEVEQDIDVDGDVVVDVDVESPAAATPHKTTALTQFETDTQTTTEYGVIPTMGEIALAFAKANYKPAAEEVNRFVEYNRKRKWKMPLEESVPRWIANEKKKEKKRVNFDQHEYDFNEIDRALLQKQMDLPPMEGRDA